MSQCALIEAVSLTQDESSRDSFLKSELRSIPNLQELPIVYQGYMGRRMVISEDIDDAPDCLVRVPDSVGCRVSHQSAYDHLAMMKQANRSFIRLATRDPNM